MDFLYRKGRVVCTVICSVVYSIWRDNFFQECLVVCREVDIQEVHREAVQLSKKLIRQLLYATTDDLNSCSLYTYLFKLYFLHVYLIPLLSLTFPYFLVFCISCVFLFRSFVGISCILLDCNKVIIYLFVLLVRERSQCGRSTFVSQNVAIL